MFRPRNATSLVAVLLLTVTTAGCQREPIPELTQPAVATGDTEAKVLQLLTVTAEGTVAITDEAKMAALLGRSWPGAQSELSSLNQRIRSGRTNGFHSTTDLARYTSSQPSYQPTLDQTGEVIFTEASDPPDPKNPQCRDKCDPHLSLCCCDGWWVFCWNPCACKP